MIRALPPLLSVRQMGQYPGTSALAASLLPHGPEKEAQGLAVIRRQNTHTHTHRRPGVCIRGAVVLPSSLMPKVKPGVDPNPNLKSSQMGGGKPKVEAQAHLILMF